MQKKQPKKEQKEPKAPEKAAEVPSVEPKAPEKAAEVPSAEPKAPEKAAEVLNADTKAPDLSQGLEPISTKYSDGHNAYKIAPNGTKTVINRAPFKEGGTRVSTSVTKDGYSYLKFVTYDKNKKVLETGEWINVPTFVNPAKPGDHGYAEAKKEVFAKLREGLKWEE